MWTSRYPWLRAHFHQDFGKQWATLWLPSNLPKQWWCGLCISHDRCCKPSSKLPCQSKMPIPHQISSRHLRHTFVQSLYHFVSTCPICQTASVFRGHTYVSAQKCLAILGASLHLETFRCHLSTAILETQIHKYPKKLPILGRHTRYAWTNSGTNYCRGIWFWHV